MWGCGKLPEKNKKSRKKLLTIGKAWRIIGVRYNNDIVISAIIIKK